MNDPDYYEWETHIFFDDAMEPDDEGKDFVPNQFVTLLCTMVQEVGSLMFICCVYVYIFCLLFQEAYKWYKHKNAVPHPQKYPTPYGGRLIWTMPGGTQIICHLKDKNKIRHKKRWSQCMYM